MTCAHFIVVVNECLPVVLPFHGPRMVELVVIHREVVQSRLRVCPSEGLFPWHAGFTTSLKVDPDEAANVNMDVDWKQTILVLAEPIDRIETRSLGKVSR